MEFSLYEIVSGVAMTLYLVRCWLTKTFDYWRKRKVAGPRPLPIFGSFKDVVLKRIHAADYIKSIYDAYPGEPAVGLFSRSVPLLLIKDPNMIKDVLIKNFLTFPNRGLKVHEDIEPFPQHLMFLEYKRWKQLRKKLNPAFALENIEEMSYLVDECAIGFIHYLENLVEKGEPIECQELTARFITDVIGSYAFGLDMNAMKQEDNEFRKIARQLLANSCKNKLNILSRYLPHWLAVKLKPIIRKENMINYFVDTVNRIMECRKANNLRRNDFIDHLIDLKDYSEQIGHENMSNVFLTAQAYVFFVAGFETSCTTMSNAMYELALNPDVQTKLGQEIYASCKKNNGKLNFETVRNMKYLDQVFQETLRKYPPEYCLLRVAADDHMFEESRILITKGTKILIPTYAIHHDTDIYSEPEKFDPKRFEDNVVKSRSHMTYLPFGDGPRNCIGERFARYQIKLGLATAVRHFKFEICEKTRKFHKNQWRSPKERLYLKIEKKNL